MRWLQFPKCTCLIDVSVYIYSCLQSGVTGNSTALVYIHVALKLLNIAYLYILNRGMDMCIHSEQIEWNLPNLGFILIYIFFANEIANVLDFAYEYRNHFTSGTIL